MIRVLPPRVVRITRRTLRDIQLSADMSHRVWCPTRAELAKPVPFVITAAAMRDIHRTIGMAPAEQGGMLGGRRTRGTVTNFVFDDDASRTRATYSPDTDELNRILRDDWNPSGTDLLGFVHSHPTSATQPSGGDAAYAERILAAIPDMDRLLLPIVQTVPDGGRFRMRFFAATRARRGVTVTETDHTIVADTRPPLPEDAFERVRDAYDLELMAATRVVVVGVGGAAGWVESMARAGVGEFVLVDPDVVEAPNIATQQVYRSDIGRPKVHAVAERILDVRPDARIACVQAGINELDDHAMERLVHRPLPNGTGPGPDVTILCGFTDDFYAQARVNRLALHLGVPQIAAQVYREGRGVEVVFTAPGLTPACARCVLGARYRGYLLDGYRNDVSSNGTPLWATERLNALKSEVALALIHTTAPVAPDEHPARARYRALAERIAARNLIQARLDPDIAVTLGLTAFDRALQHADGNRIVTDETLWLPQDPEHPQYGFAPCADCGGAGDLTNSRGRFRDTRYFPAQLRPLETAPSPIPSDIEG